MALTKPGHQHNLTCFADAKSELEEKNAEREFTGRSDWCCEGILGSTTACIDSVPVSFASRQNQTRLQSRLMHNPILITSGMYSMYLFIINLVWIIVQQMKLASLFTMFVCKIRNLGCIVLASLDPLLRMCKAKLGSRRRKERVEREKGCASSALAYSHKPVVNRTGSLQDGKERDCGSSLFGCRQPIHQSVPSLLFSTSLFCSKPVESALKVWS